MHLALYNDQPDSTTLAEGLSKQNLLERVKSVDTRARRHGVASLDVQRNGLIALGMELDGNGRVTKNGYGIFHLSWQAEEHPEWSNQIQQELQEIRNTIRQTHKTTLRFLIWAGMGGSAEDKSMYNACGLLKRGPRCYVLDSTDPAKLKAILDDMQRRSGLPLAAVLQSTLVVGMAMGMTSFEPVVNLMKLAALYDRNKVDSKANFVYMTLPGSILDQFASARGYRKIELQMDGGNSTAGRHSGPLTRGSLYPLGLSRNDLDRWISETFLKPDEIQAAWNLAAFLYSQAKAGRDKITLLLPRNWTGAGLWTKQDFEESLGKREDFGLKVVIGEKPRLANYRAPKDPLQDRVFLALHFKGKAGEDARKLTLLRAAGYPVAVLTLTRESLSRYMQFIHYVVFGIAYLAKMNFVTQPNVELYKSITARIYAEAQRVGSIEETEAWSAMRSHGRRADWQGRVTLYYDRLPGSVPKDATAPEIYAHLLGTLAADRGITYGELTYFGDTRYSPSGKAMLRTLEHAAERLFRACLKMPVDVYEGPAMNHSYHEMVIGRGGCFSTVLLSEKSEKIRQADYTADYHRTQFLATILALAERKRPVVGLVVKDLEPVSLAALESFYKHAVTALRSSRTKAHAAVS